MTRDQKLAVALAVGVILAILATVLLVVLIDPLPFVYGGT